MHNHNTRRIINFDNDGYTMNLFVPFARTFNNSLQQIRADGPRIWNEIPNHIKNITSLNMFLTNLKNHYISQYVE